jgi:hypothetical protein
LTSIFCGSVFCGSAVSPEEDEVNGHFQTGVDSCFVFLAISVKKHEATPFRGDSRAIKLLPHLPLTVYRLPLTAHHAPLTAYRFQVSRFQIDSVIHQAICLHHELDSLPLLAG